MSKRAVTFSKSVTVIVESIDDLDALRTALALEGTKKAFDEAQTLFTVEDVEDDMAVGIVQPERVEEII